MRRIWPFLIVGILVAGVLWIGSLIDDLPSLGVPGSVYNTEENGGAALERWLIALEYDVERMEYVEWEFTAEQDALLILAPSTFFQAGETDTVLEWVRDTGSTLIVVDSGENALHRDLDIVMADEPAPASISPNQPLGNPPVTTLKPRGPAMVTTRRDVAVLAGTEDEPVVLALAEGRGMVYFVSWLDVITNQGLRDENNARLLQNLLSRVPQGGTILFDEIHHGRALPPKVPRKPVILSPLVAGIVYASLAIGLWALLSGRRFGSIVPTRMEVARRSSAEYVQSMAGLFQRGRQTGYILGHYKTAFKRRIAKPYGFNPRLADEQYVREISRFTTVDEARLLGLLTALSNSRPSEESLLRLVNAADEFAVEFEQQH
ncbi:MAG: DUF4350 domain-containing protein [Herpetosiphonaceae bacterium]|nr:DUF4350 domain-containing protein [Herpetosiphonaceae bacterium]